MNFSAAFSRRSDAGKNFQYGGLTTSVLANDSYSFTTLDLEGDVFESPEEVSMTGDRGRGTGDRRLTGDRGPETGAVRLPSPVFTRR